SDEGGALGSRQGPVRCRPGQTRHQQRRHGGQAPAKFDAPAAHTACSPNLPCRPVVPCVTGAPALGEIRYCPNASISYTATPADRVLQLAMAAARVLALAMVLVATCTACGHASPVRDSLRTTAFVTLP